MPLEEIDVNPEKGQEKQADQVKVDIEHLNQLSVITSSFISHLADSYVSVIIQLAVIEMSVSCQLSVS